MPKGSVLQDILYMYMYKPFSIKLYSCKYKCIHLEQSFEALTKLAQNWLV